MSHAAAASPTEQSNGPQAPARSSGAVRLLALAVLGVLCLGHAWLTLRLFPSWQALTDNEPVISVDHAIHLYHGYLGAKFLVEHGTSWGYDPYFMAGYPKTPVYDSSSAPAELFQLVAGGGYSPRAYKIGIALLVSLMPLALLLAAWGYGHSAPSTVATALCALAFWWVGYADTLVRTGLVAFVWASTLAVLVPALFVRWARVPRSGNWLLLCAAATWGIQSHSIFPLMVAAPLALGYLVASLGRFVACGRGDRPGWRWHTATWSALSIALLATLFWWWPLLKFLPLKTASDLFMTYRGEPHDSFAMRIGKLLLSTYVFKDASLPLLVMLFGCVGLTRWCVNGAAGLAAVCGIQLLMLSLLTFMGSEWEVTRNLEPLRFQVPLGLLWCIPAGQGVAAVFAALSPRNLRGIWSQRVRWAAAALFLGCATALTFPVVWWRAAGLNPAAQLPSSWKIAWLRLHTQRPLSVGLKPEMIDLVQWITSNTDGSARILFEDQLRLLEQQDPSSPESLHWTPLLPLLTGREFVGGLYHLAFIPHRHAAFGDWNLAGKPIDKWSSQELAGFLDQYNIGWVVTWSRASPLKQSAGWNGPLSTDRFANLAGCELVARIRRHTTRPDEAEYSIFRVNRDHSYFAVGQGRVRHADYNRIELESLRPDRGQIVLRYHWLDQFRSEPPLPLERVEDSADPVGFIRIRTDEPVERLTLINGY